MSTKRYEEGITKRIRALIDKEGGQTAFAKRVWGDPLPHKGKVNKWYLGTSGIRPDEAVAIAKVFKVRAAWLLLGELPEREGVTRTEAKLADDLAAYVAEEGVAKAGTIPEPWLRDMIPSMIHGPTLLQYIVEEVAADMRANVAHFRDKAAIAKEIRRIESALEALNFGRTGEMVNADGVLAILKRLFAAPPPAGKTIPWQPVEFARASGQPAQTKRAPRIKR